MVYRITVFGLCARWFLWACEGLLVYWFGDLGLLWWLILVLAMVVWILMFCAAVGFALFWVFGVF